MILFSKAHNKNENHRVHETNSNYTSVIPISEPRKMNKGMIKLGLVFLVFLMSGSHVAIFIRNQSSGYTSSP